MKAIEIIKRSMLLQHSVFFDALVQQEQEDLRYLASRVGTLNPITERSIRNRAQAAVRARHSVAADNSEAFIKDMAAGIIALNVACKLQLLPPHVRTAAAVETWG